MNVQVGNKIILAWQLSKGIQVILDRDFREKNLFCDHCKISGHTIQRCYKIHGYPPGHKFHKPNGLTAHVNPNFTAQWPSPQPINPASGTVNSNFPAQGLSVPQPTNQVIGTNSVPQFIADQYNQLLKMLNKHNLDTNNSSLGKENISPMGFLAGNAVCLLSSITNDKSIIDSGAQ